MGRAGGARGARARPGRTGPGLAGLGQAVTHRGLKPTTRTTTKRNPIANQKSKTERDVHATNHDIRPRKICFGMMQHP
jgi:hypothetical protein